MFCIFEKAVNAINGGKNPAYTLCGIPLLAQIEEKMKKKNPRLLFQHMAPSISARPHIRSSQDLCKEAAIWW